MVLWCGSRIPQQYQCGIQTWMKSCFLTTRILNSGVFTVFAQYDFGKERHFSVRPEFIPPPPWAAGSSDIGKDMYERKHRRYPLRFESRFVDIRVPLVYSFMKAESRIRPYVYIAPVIGFATRGTIRMQEDFANGEYVGYGLDLSKANMASMYFAGMVGIGAKYQFKMGKYLLLRSGCQL